MVSMQSLAVFAASSTSAKVQSFSGSQHAARVYRSSASSDVSLYAFVSCRYSSR